MQAIATPAQTPQSPNFLTQDNEPHPAHVFCGRKRRTKYAYDYGQRWVRKTLDTDADGTIEQSQVFVHSGGQIVLDFQKTGTSDASNSDLAHRYLWGANIDDLLADETVDDATEDDVAWALTDHLGSVRDLVVYDPVALTVSVIKHVAFDACGNITSDTATGIGSLFLYTARPFDGDTGLQNNLNRWHDATTGRWLSLDPFGIDAGDSNLYRYVHNAPTLDCDPFGLAVGEKLDFNIGIEGYEGIGGGITFISWSEDSEWCCDAAGNSGYKKTDDIRVQAQIGIGLGVEVSLFRRSASVLIKFGTIYADLGGECEYPCNDDDPASRCCRICGDVGFTLPMLLPVSELGIGTLAFDITLKAVISGSIRNCYNFGPGCSETGYAIGFCGSTTVEASISKWGKSYYIKESVGGCYAIGGSPGMLDW